MALDRSRLGYGALVAISERGRGFCVCVVYRPQEPRRIERQQSTNRDSHSHRAGIMAGILLGKLQKGWAGVGQGT